MASDTSDGSAASSPKPTKAANAHSDTSDDDEFTIDVSRWKRNGSGPGNTRTSESRASQGPAVRLSTPKVIDLGEYQDFTEGAEVVRRVKAKQYKGGRIVYNVIFEDGHAEEITGIRLRQYENGPAALEEYQERDEDLDLEEIFDVPKASSNMRSTRQAREAGMVDTTEALAFLDDDQSDHDDSVSSGDQQPVTRKGRTRKSVRKTHDSDDESDEPAQGRSLRSSAPVETGRRTRSKRSISEVQRDDESSDDDDDDFMRSDILPRKRHRPSSGLRSRREPSSGSDGLLNERVKRARREGVRQSGRSTRHQGDMEEVGVNDIYRSDSQPRPTAPPKAVGAKETFIDLPRTDAFRMRHIQQCDSCGNGTNFAPLIYCQGCAFAYHKNCIGTRGSREHLVTKVGEGDFVLQCRRCISFPRRKEPTAPDQAKCQDCKCSGNACRPFRSRKTAVQEQKDREDNDGQDPICPVDPDRLNNAANVLFRCTNCFRGFHFEHLPPRSDYMEMDSDTIGVRRFNEYGQDWRCKECISVPGKIGGLVAWKPVDEDNYDATSSFEIIDEDDKVYLVRWENKSYFQCSWMPGPWVWSVAAAASRKAFAKRDEARVPKMRTEDAIPEEYLRTDIVLDVKYTSIVDAAGQEIDKARIREVDKALIKLKGLGYEDAVWEKPPLPEDEDRWTDFVTAYNDWVLGKYVRLPKAGSLKVRLDKARSMNFEDKLAKKKQPDNTIGGELMKYQVDGLNWLYYKWYEQKNAILADEMGLGKTIQIIGFLATLAQEWNCSPFLVVVPNSTCANWRREIKQWAPSLRVVAYFGSKEARDLAYRYELYPNGSKELRCHVVVTSYDCAADDSSRKFLRSLPWQAMVVDEGQRLKNDRNLLYAALAAINVPFKVLLTGTPLQNNARELFNLLQFLDSSFDAAKLEEEFAELTSENIARLHDMIRPFFLRRTKAQVLTFLPPMAQIIVPVSMSLVQKKLYRSILSKSPELMKAIFAGSTDLKRGERASLNNILMQLRKCLCHPFVYSQSIEERNVSQAVSHRNLVDASGKLQLLELLLPKLKERGHRVLIFSQFLDQLSMVEDFLDGLELQYQRLDGSLGSLQKQRRIDEFNAPNSELFCFLLSTRAGGVGINLATADTVIILDPDFNPHQDIQALSRAHRIGQKKKVLCFQLVTRASAEEKIVQIGRKKMALDHVLIEQMDAEDASDMDLESILRYGAAEIFSEDSDKEIRYDSAAIDKLLDRSQIEDTSAGADQSAESQFSFARVWANNALEDKMDTEDMEEAPPDPSVWDKILKERERAAAAEAAAVQQALGRGRRAKANVDYGANSETKEIKEALQDDHEAVVPDKKEKRGDDDSDTDFQEDSDQDSEPEAGVEEHVDPRELDETKPGARNGKVLESATKPVPTFARVQPQPIPNASLSHGLPPPPVSFFTHSSRPASVGQSQYPPPVTYPEQPIDRPLVHCVACQQIHPEGNCPLKRVGVEYCNLCGIAHLANLGAARVCPHLNSETQVALMLQALKQSPEQGELVNEARRYLKSLKGNLVQKKRKQLLQYQQQSQQIQLQIDRAKAAEQPRARFPQVQPAQAYHPIDAANEYLRAQQPNGMRGAANGYALSISRPSIGYLILP